MPPGYQDPESTVFVSNIENRVTEEILWELFLQAGPLRNVHIPTDRSTGKNKTFGFVTYRHPCSVSFACELFNSLELFKRRIYCKPSNTNKTSTSSSNNNSSTASGSPNYATPIRPIYASNSSQEYSPSPGPFSQDATRSESSRRDYGSSDRDSDRRGSGSYSSERGRSREDLLSTFFDLPSNNSNRNLEELSRYDPRADDRSSSRGYRPNEIRRYDHQSGNSGRGNYHHPNSNKVFLQAMNNQYQRGGGSGNNYNNYNDNRSYNSHRRDRDNYGPMRNNDPVERHRMNRRQRPY